MKYLERLLILSIAALLASCSGLQVQRDLDHAEVAKRYRTSLDSAADAVAAHDCALRGTMNAWTSFELSASTPIVKMPSGMKAAAVCVAIPAGARALEVQSTAKGGMTYFELTVVHPSLQFLDGGYALVKDLQKPRLSAGEGFFRGFGLSGIVVLTDDLAAAKYVLVYAHPDSLEGAVDVYTGYQTIPVPYGPYGAVKVRFR